MSERVSIDKAQTEEFKRTLSNLIQNAVHSVMRSEAFMDAVLAVVASGRNKIKALDVDEDPPPRAMREVEFCKRAGISQRTAQAMRAANPPTLGFCRVGTRIFYLEEHLRDFWEKHAVKVGAKTELEILDKKYRR